MKHLNIRGASWDSMFLALVKIFTTLSSIVVTKILSLGLSLNEYGTYSQANIVVAICTSIILMGFGDALNYFYNSSNDKSKKDRIHSVNTIYFIELVLGIIVSLVVIFAKDAIEYYFSNEALGIVLIICSTKPLLDNLISFYQILYVSIGKAKIIAIRNILTAILRIVLVYISVYVFSSIVAIFISLLIIDVAQLLFFAIIFSKDGFLINPFKYKTKLIKPIIYYGLPMGVFSATCTLSREIDKLVIGYFSGTEDLAIYSNCSKILPFDIFVTSFAVVLIPYIMKYLTSGNLKNTTMVFKEYLKIGYYSVWVLGFAAIIVSEQLIPLLYTEDYLIGKHIFICYVIDSMIRFASMHLILTSSGKSKLLMFFSVSALGLNLILNVLFYHLFGLIGPAIATLFVSLLYTFAILGSSLKILDSKWGKVFEAKSLVMYISCLLLTAVVFSYANKHLVKYIDKYIAMIIVAFAYCFVNVVINYKKIRCALKSINQIKLN